MVIEPHESHAGASSWLFRIAIDRAETLVLAALARATLTCAPPPDFEPGSPPFRAAPGAGARPLGCAAAFGFPAPAPGFVAGAGCSC